MSDPDDLAYDRYEAALLDGDDLLDPDRGWDFTPGPDRAPTGPLEDF